jgi:cytochrome c
MTSTEQRTEVMTVRLQTLYLSAAALLLPCAVLGAGQASPEDAKALAIQAAEYLKANGPDKAFAEFNAKDGRWHDRDLYITVQDNKGVMVAHGTNPGLIGRNVLDLKDPEGKPFNHDLQAIKDVGWVNFHWQNPLTKGMEEKTAYEVRVGDHIVGVGAYAR